jgi:acyl-CoA dehydrogenase
MNFELNENQRNVQNEIQTLLDKYDQGYWQQIRQTREFPNEFYEELTSNRWIGTMIPKKYGGKGLGLLELVIVMEEIAAAGGWSTGLIGGAIFGGLTVEYSGTPEQKEELLTGILKGERWALGVTEPEAGVNTANISTSAERVEGGYVLKGHKRFIGGIDHAERFLVLARTTPKTKVESPLNGISLFVLDPQEGAITYDEIDLEIYWPLRVHQVEIDEIFVKEKYQLGTIDEGFYQLLDVLNAERVAAAAQVYGVGEWALNKATRYAAERTVWDEPIGAHQSIQHPLAKSFMSLRAAKCMIRQSAWKFDSDTMDSSIDSNIAKYLAAQAAWKATEAAMTTFGGRSATTEDGIAAAWEFVRHVRTAPIPEEMICNFIASKALNLPKSY